MVMNIKYDYTKQIYSHRLYLWKPLSSHFFKKTDMSQLKCWGGGIIQLGAFAHKMEEELEAY